MKKISLVAIALVASVSFAQTAKKTETPKTAAVPAAAAAPVLKKMDVKGKINWVGFGVGKTHTGEIAIKSGFAEIKGDDLVGGTFILDMTTLKTGDSPKLETHLKSEDFFNVEKFKEGSFKITKVEALKAGDQGSPTHKVTGDLTIKGKTHSEELMVNVGKQGEKFNVAGFTEIKDRTQYDIVYNSAKFKTVSALGDKLIEDKIKIALEVQTK